MTLLRNLVLNAAADTSGNGIRVWSVGDRRKIRIGVTDCGSGISEEKVEKIKEPF